MGQFALVFPGQGSHHPGMGQDLYRRHQSVRDLFAEASDVFGWDMVSLCFDGPQERLDLTVNTQTSILTVDIAALRALSERVKAQPLVMAGHSLGEYAALHAAGAVGLRDVLALVRDRAQYHQEAVPVGEGAMAAVLNLPGEAVEDLCRAQSRDGRFVALSIENAPGQIVVSGHTAAVQAVIAAAQNMAGAKAVLLPISVPCHSPLLRAAADRLAKVLKQAEFKDCIIPVIPNCDPSTLHSREITRDLLFRQIICPVRWVQTIEKMEAMGVDTIVEVGPKRVMSGLIRRINRKIRLLNVEDEESLERTAATLNGEAEEQRLSPC